MTIKSFLFIFTFVFVSLYSFCQEQLWLKQSKLSEIINFERQINPKVEFEQHNVSLSKSYYPLADKYITANPLIAQRAPFDYLPLYAEYFYTQNDSILRLVSYDWEKDKYGNFFDKQKMWPKEAKKLKVYNKEYERIKSLVITKLGTPTVTDSIPQKETSNRGEYFTRESKWETAEFYAELSMIFESMTYRIRLTLYWKN